MDRRFAARRDQLLADAEVDPRIPRGVLPRLERFLDPFVELLQRSEQGGHARTMSPACSPTWRARTSSRSLTCMTASVRVCRSSSAKPTGTTVLCSPNWLGKWERNWARPTASWSSTLLPSPRRGRSRWAYSGSGAAGLASSTTARSASIWATSAAANTPWSTSAFTCPRSGPGPAAAAKGGSTQRGPLPHAARAGPGDAGRAWTVAAARLDRRRRRDGPLLVVPRGIALAGRVLLAGGAVQYLGAGLDRGRSADHGLRPAAASVLCAGR